MRGNLVPPGSIWKANSATTTNVLSTTSNPIPDHTVTGDESFENSGRTTMNFKSFYGSQQPTQMFAPLDVRGYSTGNVIYDHSIPSSSSSSTQPQQIHPLSNLSTTSHPTVFGGSEDNDDALFNTVGSSGGGGGGGGGKNKDGRSTQRGLTERDTEENNPWLVRSDPLGGGRSYLLRELKAKFIEVSTPITRFVSRYLAERGEYDESKLHEFIRIRPLFSIAEQTHDWEGLVQVLYGRGSPTNRLPGGQTSPLFPYTQDNISGGGGIDKEELANTLLHLVTVEEAHRRARLANQDDYDNNNEVENHRKQAQELIKILKSRAGLTANTLKNHYDNTISGKVVFLLHPILREAAQSLLDIINERWRTSLGKSKFTLLEVMNSSSVLTVFIKLMILAQNTTNMGGVTGTLPITNNGLGGSYGTLGDRVTAGSASYQKKTYGNTTVVQSRPSVANMVGTSREYAEGLWYFAHVEKDKKGGLCLISELANNHHQAQYGDWDGGGGGGGYYNNNGRGHPRLYYDHSRDMYQTQDKVRNYNIDHAKTLVPTGPIESIKSAIEKMGVGGHGNSNARYKCHTSQHLPRVDEDGIKYDPHILSYVSRDGRTLYVKREIILDQRAMRKFYQDGELSEQYIIDLH